MITLEAERAGYFIGLLGGSSLQHWPFDLDLPKSFLASTLPSFMDEQLCLLRSSATL